jgi:hypothetical protein
MTLFCVNAVVRQVPLPFQITEVEDFIRLIEMSVWYGMIRSCYITCIVTVYSAADVAYSR